MRARRAAADRKRRVAVLLGCVTWCVGVAARAATLDWAGHTWQLTSGGMAGVCEGSPANVSVDGNGYLHLRISHDGGTWSASELFTTDRLGFGTYQWQVEGPVDTYDKNVVLGLFPYGPQANLGADGTNEIDIEYSRWGQANGPNGDFTDYPASGMTVGERSFTFSLSGLTSTSRFVWSSTRIASSLFDGLEPLLGSAEPLETWTYAPSAPATNIPQMALPLGMNLWCFDAPPSDANPVEIIIHGFEFVAEGAAGSGGSPGGAAGMGNAGGSPGGAAGAVNAGGRPGGASGALNTGGKPGGAAGAMNAGGKPGGAAGAMNAGGKPGGTAGALNASGESSGGNTGDNAGGAGGVVNVGGQVSEAAGAGNAGSSQASSASAGCNCSLVNVASPPACSSIGLLFVAWLVRRLRRTSSVESPSRPRG
jgi:hypothetical protein